MKYAVFTVNIKHPDTDELNIFLNRHRIVNVSKKFIQDDSSSYWTFLIEYIEKQGMPEKQKAGKKSNIDYREILSEDDFKRFAALRDLRKTVAEKDSIPVYNIFNNAQLAEMVTRNILTLENMRRIPGIGESKMEKYGDLFLKKLQELINEENR
jgi:ATP-dependent DNA helicase RecQ